VGAGGGIKRAREIKEKKVIMSVKELKTVIRERLSPEFERLIEDSKRKEIGQKASEVIYEYEAHGNFFLVRRYDIIYRGNKYHCFQSLNLLVLCQSDKDRLNKLGALIPDKFLFQNLVYLTDLGFDDEVIVNKYCINRVVPIQEMELGEGNRNEGFNARAADVLVRHSVLNSDTLILAPSEWVYGVIRGIKPIAQMMRNSGNGGWGNLL